jgi:hypothetical protein
MFEIYFYEDKSSNSPIYEYMQALSQRFVKKTQKTPKREIEQAKRNLKDIQERDEL